MDVSDLMDLKAYVDEKLEGKVDEAEIAIEELNLTTSADNIVAVMKFLRDDVQTQFHSFIDICGVDYPERAQRFDVVYHLLSPRQNMRVRVRVKTDAETPVPSVVEIIDFSLRQTVDTAAI